jgi:hypothetical protein
MVQKLDVFAPSGDGKGDTTLSSHTVTGLDWTGLRKLFLRDPTEYVTSPLN